MNYDLKAWFNTISRLNAGELALGMFADWLDDQGHPFAEGMRWVYDNGGEPEGRSYFVNRGTGVKRIRTWTWYYRSGIAADIFWAFQPRLVPKKHRYAMGNEHKTKRAAWLAFYHSWMKARVKDEEPVRLFGR